MKDRSRRSFTAKIIVSYALLVLLGLIASIFIYSEIKTYTSSDLLERNDEKLLKTSSLLTGIYISENLSTLAQQRNTNISLKKYKQKVDSLFSEIDTLKVNSKSDTQKQLLDSIQLLLQQKVFNVSELRKLRRKNNTSNSIDSLLKEFGKIEVSIGHITPESFVSNFNELPDKSREVIKNYVSFLNKNIPDDEKSKKLDSVLAASKLILSEAKLQSEKTNYELSKKERELSNANLTLSLKLQRIISVISEEITSNTIKNEKIKNNALAKSIRLAGLAAIIGLLVVTLFTFLINKDFWRIQTYRRKLESEKAFSESVLKSREQLIATVGHDLKTPLNTILGYSDLLHMTPLNDTQLYYVESVVSASKYVDGLVNDLLDFSKIEAGKIKLEHIPFRIDQLITQLTEDLKEFHDKKRVVLILDISHKLKNEIIGDALRVKQILANLIGNAIKFTHKGSVTIKANIEKENTLRIDVADTGIGIKKELQKAIFQEFSQGEDTIGKKYGGYGLGLTISKKLIELLGGTIQLKSKEGKGSTFTFTIPFVFAKKSPTKIERAKLNSITLLIIDNDLALLDLLKEMCNTVGIGAHTFSNFNSVQKNDAIHYDAVLTDIQMPVVDGFKVAKKLRSGDYQHYRQQPILAMTGQTHIDEQFYISKGFTKVVQKPFTKEVFLEKLVESLPKVKNNYTCDKKTAKTTLNKEAGLYDLTDIKAFLGDDTLIVKDVLTTFLQTSQENIRRLKEFITLRKVKKVNELAHQMLPMFRQLKAYKIVPYLEQLEVMAQQSDSEKMTAIFNLLNKHVNNLVGTIQNDFIIRQDCND
ncbi:hybrid sensor histidine kinase/response regulator [Croceitalea marina]|uniref:histidine kinase n=1 Tax=Croceitalea marina TaxID=1775166 RepID=A0ABW5MT37_9FLAO